MERAALVPDVGGVRDASVLRAPDGLEAWLLDVGGQEFALIELPPPVGLRTPARALEHAGAAPCPLLTAAEAHVVQLMRRGLSNSEIARHRGTKPRTVANQAASIFRKVRVRSRLELCAVFAALHDGAT